MDIAVTILIVTAAAVAVTAKVRQARKERLRKRGGRRLDELNKPFRIEVQQFRKAA